MWLKAPPSGPSNRDMDERDAMPTAETLISPSIAPKVAAEAHEILATLATGKWRRSMRDRLANLDRVVASWAGSSPRARS